MPINIEGGLLVDGQEVGAGGLTSYTATVSFTSDTDGLITYDVVPSDDAFLLSMTVNSNTAANTDLAGSTLNVVMHKSEISMTIEGETQTMLGYAGVLVVGDLSNKFDIFVTLPVGTATSGIIQMKNSEKKLYLHTCYGLNLYSGDEQLFGPMTLQVQIINHDPTQYTYTTLREALMGGSIAVVNVSIFSIGTATKTNMLVSLHSTSFGSGAVGIAFTGIYYMIIHGSDGNPYVKLASKTVYVVSLSGDSVKEL